MGAAACQDGRVARSSPLRRTLKWSAVAWDLLRRPAPGVVVLAYHRVGGRSGLEVDLPVGLFDEQLAWLTERHRVVSLSDALDALRGPTDRRGPPGAVDAGGGGGPVPSTVAVTFDDGTADFVTDALPVLVRHRVPATLYLATDFVDTRRSFPHGGAPLSWAAVAEAYSTGLVEVGSHTHTHRLLDRVGAAETAEELDRSCELIGDHLGRVPVDFAYPKAVAPGVEAAREVAARFRSAALAGTRANPVGATDPLRLARSPVQRSDGMAFFARKVAGGMEGEDRVRTLVNRRRYATAST